MTRALRLLLACVALVIAAAVVAGAASARTVWLCQPGHSPDPCNVGLSTTVFSPTLHKLKVIDPARVKKPAIDCFYVYPTVSDQSTPLANLQIDPEERSVALYQAARYSQYCRVFAPMYRQVTLSGLFSGKVTANRSRSRSATSAPRSPPTCASTTMGAGSCSSATPRGRSSSSS